MALKADGFRHVVALCSDEGRVTVEVKAAADEPPTL